jgi:hypothetical protein
MAKSSEHRMLFDIRGKRKRVIQVVYALLAGLMALSLLTVVGPVSLGDLVGTGGSSSGSSFYDDEAAKIETKLRKDPQNEQLLLQLTRDRYNAGQQLLLTAQQGGDADIAKIVDEFQKSGDAWVLYLKHNPGKPSAAVAPLVAQAFSALTQTSSTATEYRTNAKHGAEAQKIATEARPTLNNLYLLAQSAYLAFDYAAGDKAAKEAIAKTPATQQKNVEQQLAQAKKQAQKQEKAVKAAAKAQGKAGKQELQGGSLGGLSGGGSGLSGGGLSGAP